MLEVTYKATAELIPYVNNTRLHTEEQVSQVASSIKEFGFTNPILIDEDGGVIAGHGRLMAAKLLKLTEVPTITLSGLSEAQKKAYVIADNKLALNSAWDYDLLKVELESLKELDFDTSLLGFGQVELDSIFKEEIDMSMLEELDDSEVDEFAENVRRGIVIEFESEDYDEAQELIKFWRAEGAYVGGLIIDHLRKEKDKL